MADHTNLLIHETSPYLLQHAHNPVQWYPWGDEALQKARDENKPILLSIGYAACHWCHVMAHESFSDVGTAEIMNNLFINIKVDREERPDLDKVYQSTHYLLTQRSGGWPLTVFLTPDEHIPFFSGTYFPLQAKYQLPAFKEVLLKISEFYLNHPSEINNQNVQLMQMLNPPEPIINDAHLNLQPLQNGLQVLAREYDTLNGGFGNAPKFPQPTKLALLLKNNSPLVFSSLTHMAKGGIYDQLGGGFFRYSVDAEWRIPHFEKMLYDNAQLIELYALAYKQTGDELYARVADETARWVISKMQSSEGGYYSSVDADSEGIEGKYYVWNIDEIKSLLTADEFAIIQIHYGLNDNPNFENQWHLNITQIVTDESLISAKKKLLTARNKRTAPAIDTKVLTAWNALMIKAMYIAGDVLNEPSFIQSAEKALSFIQSSLWKDQHLLATNNKPILAYLDDYAFLIDALIVSGKQEHISFACDLSEILLNHFSDPKGGFYFTSNTHEKLLYRPKSMMDEALPAGNSIAARAFLSLRSLTGDLRYSKAAEKTLQAAWPLVMHYPTSHCSMLETIKDILENPKH